MIPIFQYHQGRRSRLAQKTEYTESRRPDPHPQKKGKGLVNYIHKLCLTGMQLANALLNYLLQSKHAT